MAAYSLKTLRFVDPLDACPRGTSWTACAMRGGSGARFNVPRENRVASTFADLRAMIFVGSYSAVEARAVRASR